MTDQSRRVVVLDFDGVCTYSAAELIARDIAATDPPERLVRPQWSKMWEHFESFTVVVFGNELDRSLIPDVSVLARADHVLSGLDNGIAKPDRRAFQRCALVAGRVKPEWCLVIDDAQTNVEVAASLGMHTVWFDPTRPDASFGEIIAGARALADAH